MDVMTENKLAPQLRFKDNNKNDYSDLKEKRLVDICSKKSSNISANSIKANDGDFLIYGAKGILKKIDFYREENSYISIVKDGAGVGRVLMCKPFSSVLGTLDVIIQNEGNDLYYIYTLLQRINFLRYIKGSTIPHVYFKDYSLEKIKVPSLEEQQKIGSFLARVDEKLQQLTKKKSLLQDYKKGFMQQIFSQQLSFKDANGNNYPNWKEKKLGEVLFEHKLKSTANEEVFSVSVHKGVVNQIEHLGRSFSAKNTDHYSLVKPNDIIYTKSPTGSFPFGIIKQAKTQSDVIVSPLYAVFTPETSSLGYMLDVYFESNINVHNYLHQIIQKGAKNTINITNNTFLSNTLKLPVDKEEQKKIGEFLISLNAKLELVSTQIENTKAFKKGLLQQMFV